MKKTSLLFGAAVLMLAASCSNDEVVREAENNGMAIGFSSFVDNATRADYSTTNLPDNMQVWGVTKFENEELRTVFANQLVERNGVAASAIWTYTPLQYWIPGNSYSFAAIAPYYENDNNEILNVEEVKNEAGNLAKATDIKITFDNSKAEANVDLLYDAVEVAADNYATVGFNMKHMLSRVNFKFENAFDADNYILEVTDVNITDATAKAIISKAENATLWTAEGEGVFTRNFDFAEDVDNANIAQYGNVVTNNYYIIPLKDKKSHTVTFKVQLYSKNTGSDKIEITTNPIQHTVTIPEMNFVNGYSYTFVAKIDNENINPNPDDPDVLKPIEFTVETVDDFTEDSGNDHDITPAAPEKNDNESSAEGE